MCARNENCLSMMLVSRSTFFWLKRCMLVINGQQGRLVAVEAVVLGRGGGRLGVVLERHSGVVEKLRPADVLVETVEVAAVGVGIGMNVYAVVAGQHQVHVGHGWAQPLQPRRKPLGQVDARPKKETEAVDFGHDGRSLLFQNRKQATPTLAGAAAPVPARAGGKDGRR